MWWSTPSSSRRHGYNSYNGNFPEMIGQAIQQAIPRLFGGSEGMYYSVLCRDRLGSTRIAEVIDLIEHHPHYSLIYQLTAPSVCQSWRAGTTSSRFNKLVASEVPALVLAGEHDPVTPPAGSRRVARHLQHATVIETRGGGHGVFRTNPCAEQIVVAFVANPTLRPDTSCVETIAVQAADRLYVGLESSGFNLQEVPEENLSSLSASDLHPAFERATAHLRAQCHIDIWGVLSTV
jgi:TAP-like protein